MSRCNICGKIVKESEVTIYISKLLKICDKCEKPIELPYLLQEAKRY